MPEHEYFSELCALAASAQLSPDEYRELQTHLEQCGVCRQTLAEFRQVVCRELPQSRGRAAELLQMARVRPRDEARSAFLQRARREGIGFSAEVERGRVQPLIFWRKLAPYAAVAVISAVVALTSYVALQTRGAQPSQAGQPEVTQLRADNAALERELKRASTTTEARERDLAEANSRLEAVAKQERTLDGLLRATQTRTRELESALATANLKSSDLDARLRESSATVAQARSDLEKLRATKLDTEATLVAQQDQIGELSHKLRLQAASLDMDRQLMAASRDVRDLMGARNLHITDVHDFDGQGKQSKVFGRIFYTEGKSLIFYAFDLGEKRLENAKYSFQAWGQKEGNAHSAKSLGLMYLDDKAQKRWVLKVDNPELLQHIDSVFVTIEPAGGGKKPTGQKLMYAYVGNQPNHP